MSGRPLPTVIGPTENALRALLSRVLSRTHIDSYDEWVALNLVSGAGTAAVPTIATDLEVDVSAAEETIHRLTMKNLVADLALTPSGERELRDVRQEIAAVTAMLVEGIDEADQQTARAVLDLLRERAVIALAGT